ncbi:hypothetical protein SAMN05421664_1791 [Chryseobacterium soldanellicola]|uniref:DUF5105 domain-containing protein n=1 Tax=Chryseobacterium soldanellicola TaxID=311333 RepID=A0A1H1BAL3_9FLAO|nr:hypothetical protein [Chryseobacterium soldanellicola]SDQ49018.1 hypothetical protein SAMN05421664_1791 [Chryseobacterium soldanellicola]
MKKLAIFLFLTLLFCVQNLKAQTTLKPEKVFSLYFNTFVKYDENSLSELNNYLGPVFGEEKTYSINVKKAYEDEIDNLTQLFLSGFSKDVATFCENETKAYFTALSENIKKATYSVKSIETMRNELSQSQDISEVIFDVNLKVPAKSSDFKLKNGQKVNINELKKYLKDLTDKLLTADSEKSLTMKFNLYQFYKNDKTYYWNGGPQELTWKINEFYFKNYNSNN